jgi:Spy/CpxP family protein refolding chaperone
MYKKMLTGCLLAMFLALPSNALSHDMSLGKWWHNPKTEKKLNLTKEERSQLDKQYVESRRRLIDLKSAVERERFELETLLEQKDLDEKAVDNQFKKMEKARNEMGAEFFKMILETRKILGAERFQQVKNMVKSRWRDKRHGKE